MFCVVSGNPSSRDGKARTHDSVDEDHTDFELTS